MFVLITNFPISVLEKAFKKKFDTCKLTNYLCHLVDVVGNKLSFK